MSALDDALQLLRARPAAEAAGLPAGPLRDGLDASGAGFAAVGGMLGQRWGRAILELSGCIAPAGTLSEGGVYHGAWIESTGTISAEVLSRFAPVVTTETTLLFARHQRDDGMIPYKVTADGPGYSQIQIVSPLARTVWNHFLLAGRDAVYLRTMYDAMVRYDAWLERVRDTRGTGAVEAFCTFDTGHDLSPRFWHVPDRCFLGDATRFDPGNPILPFVAPDLTANVACQREYLARIAEELGDDPEPWRAKAAASVEALFAQCFDEADGTFYDRDATGALRRVQSDVLLRVLACEVGDDAFFRAALERYLLNSGKFLAHFGFTSIAMDDPRFDPDFTRNSWAGPVNLLSLIRAPHAFEHHGRVAELALTAEPVVAALAAADRFPQCLDGWSGAPGFTEQYSPAILWFLDALERLSGIVPRPDGEVWFSGLAPTRLGHGASADAVAASRTIDGVRYELAADDDRVVVLRDGVEAFGFPRGWRVVTDRSGAPTAVVCLAATAVAGTLAIAGERRDLDLAPNDRVDLLTGLRSTAGFVAPRA